jgi:hypothetical protein
LTLRRDHNFANLIAVQEIGFIKILRAASYDGSLMQAFSVNPIALSLILSLQIPLFARHDEAILSYGTASGFVRQLCAS